MFSWGRMPFVRLAFPLIVGILLQAYCQVEMGLFLIMTILGVVGLFLMEGITDYQIAYRMRFLHAPLIAFVMMGLGGLTACVHHPSGEGPRFAEIKDATFLQGKIIESVTEKKNSYRTVVEVTAVRCSDGWIKSEGQLLLYLAKDSSLALLGQGDVILFEDNSKKVSGPSNPGEFDYRRFLSMKGIHYQQYIEQGRWTKVDSEWSVKREAERARRYFISRLESAGLGQDELAIASALLLGEKGRLSQDLMHAYAGAGAMHVLAVSGLHVGILFAMLSLLLRPMEKLDKGIFVKSILIIILLWMYAFITGLSPSVVRASTMFSAVLIGKALKRNSSIYNNLASSAFVLLCIEPYYIFQVGFQLSYLAVFGIVFLQPRIKELYYPPTKILRWAWEISCVSIAAQIATFPLSLLYFHQFPAYFLLSNLIVIPAAVLILYVGLPYLVLSTVPFIGEWLGVILNWIIKGMNRGVSWIEGLPYSVFSGIEISQFQTFLLYLIILSSIAFTVMKKKSALTYALCLTILFFGIQMKDFLSFKQFDYLAVYDVKKNSAINLLSDEYNVLICDSLLAADASAQDYQLSGNWDTHGAPSPSIGVDGAEEHGIYLMSDGLIAFKGSRLAIIDSKARLPHLHSPLAVDYIILSYYPGVRADDVSQSYVAPTVILDGSIGRPKAQKIIAGLPDSVRVHAIALDGYFEERLN